MKNAILILSACALLIATLYFFPTREEAELYGAPLRLHVLAASDSPKDQELKLTVRDAVLSYTSEITANCQTKAEAEAVISRNTGEIVRISEETLRKQGCDHKVTVELGEEYYPTRNYENLRLPAGEYTSLRVNIGEAEGQNWWCVLFPPLCTNSATRPVEESLAVGFTEGQIRILTDAEHPRYVLKFRILEILGGLFR